MFISRDVDFKEDVFPYLETNSSPKIDDMSHELLPPSTLSDNEDSPRQSPVVGTSPSTSVYLKFQKQSMTETLFPELSIMNQAKKRAKKPWDAAIEHANHRLVTATSSSTLLLQSALLPLSRLPFQCHPQVRSILYQIIYLMNLYLLSIAATSSPCRPTLNRSTLNKP